MAKTQSKQTNSTWRPKIKKKRPCVHSKTRFSKSKRSKNYKKRYRGQGRL